MHSTKETGFSNTFSKNEYFDKASLEIYDFKLIDLSTKIYTKRNQFITEFTPWFQKLHEDISGKKETVSISYKTSCAENLEAQFKESLQKDKLSTRTNIGIHKDDLEFLIDGYPLKKFGSQGQQKTLLIALKLGQSLFIEQATGLKPFLLLDDIFDKLDKIRVGNLMMLVSERKFGQIFITDTDISRVPTLFKDLDVSMKRFHIEKGTIKEHE